MSNFTDDINQALVDFTRRGPTLAAAMAAPGATPSELGAAWRAIMGQRAPGKRPNDLADVVVLLKGQLHAQQLDLERNMLQQLAAFERRCVAELADTQNQAGLVLTNSFSQFGWSPQGHVLVDPTGTPWASLDCRYNSNGSWLVLGWPRNGQLPRPVYLVEDVIRYTKSLEQERLDAVAKHQLEEQQGIERQRRAWDASPDGQIAALKAQLARLKAGQAV